MMNETSLHIRNVDTNTARRFRVLAAEHGLSQADTLEWLMVQAGVFVNPLHVSLRGTPVTAKGK